MPSPSKFARYAVYVLLDPTFHREEVRTNLRNLQATALGLASASEGRVVPIGADSASRMAARSPMVNGCIRPCRLFSEMYSNTDPKVSSIGFVFPPTVRLQG